jgi:hypothetical protein
MTNKELLALWDDAVAAHRHRGDSFTSFMASLRMGRAWVVVSGMVDPVSVGWGP